MKKILLSLAVVSFIAFTACNKEEAKATDNQETVDSTANATEGAEATTEEGVAAEGTPKFSDPEVQKYVDDYATFIKEYTAAAKSGDAAKLTTMTGNLQEWNEKSATIGEKLAANPEDAQKFNEFIQKLAMEMQSAM